MLHNTCVKAYLFTPFLFRNLGTLKRYVRNKAQPEGLIAEAYTVNEALMFCSMYLTRIETCFNRSEMNED